MRTFKIVVSRGLNLPILISSEDKFTEFVLCI